MKIIGRCVMHLHLDMTMLILYDSWVALDNGVTIAFGDIAWVLPRVTLFYSSVRFTEGYLLPSHVLEYMGLPNQGLLVRSLCGEGLGDFHLTPPFHS
jgi:hypothetical protein